MDKKLHKLKNSLPHGSVERIAELAEVSKSTVYKVLDGQRVNIKVLNVAIELALKHSQQNKDLQKKLAKL